MTMTLLSLGMSFDSIIFVCKVVFFIAYLILISFVDRDGLYCYSENLIETLQNSTVFCNIAGTKQLEVVPCL